MRSPGQTSCPDEFINVKRGGRRRMMSEGIIYGICGRKSLHSSKKDAELKCRGVEAEKMFDAINWCTKFIEDGA